MRIRQIKPEFFADPDMACLPIRARLTYIGLWLIADDAGWLPVDPVSIAHDLYGFDGRKSRETAVCTDLVILQEHGRLEIELCGHGHIPTLGRHQRMTVGVRRVEMHLKSHMTRCLSAELRGDPSASAAERNGMGTERGKGNGTERNGTVAREGGEMTTGGLKDKLGDFATVMARGQSEATA